MSPRAERFVARSWLIARIACQRAARLRRSKAR